MQKDEGGITAMKQTPVPYPQAPLCLKILIAFLWAWAAAGALELIRPFSFPAVATLFLLGGMLLIRRRMIRLVFLLISVVALFYGIIFILVELMEKTFPFSGITAFFLGWGGLRLFRLGEVKKYYYECSCVRTKRKAENNHASGR